MFMLFTGKLKYEDLGRGIYLQQGINLEFA
jgi:hypothetical protein